jgi:hypothetical protein
MVPNRQGNVPEPLQGLGGDIRGATFEADLPSVRDSHTNIQRKFSMMSQVLDGDLERVLPELEEMAEK